MVLNDPLANALSKIERYDELGRSEVKLTHSSKLLKNILAMLKDLKYVGDANDDELERGLTLNLIGSINKCGVVKPRFPCKLEDFEKYEKRFLLSKDLGVLFVSTSQGLMTHRQAKEKGIGGKLIAYCY